MYRAKQLGGNTFQFFTAEMNMHAQQRLVLESGLRRALAEGELELHYQPKVDVLSGRINSAEALVRWRDPSRGLVPPGEFIPLAEEVGLILQIGDWVLREACRQTRRWQLDGLPAVRVAVNVAAQQFRQANFVASVREALERAELEYQIDPRWLSFEVTESAWMQNSSKHIVMIDSLRHEGSRVYIDDFGTGFSNLSYLKTLPVDAVKIDQAFIRSIETDPSDAAIVSGIIAMARQLSLATVAEGIETEAQAQRLRALGRLYGQGYYFSRPIPADNCRTLLEQLVEARQVTETLTMRAFRKVAG
jgi:EAL domain-containing protein (putative c-di-GMP-specific phosphodiesterase class I)